MTTSRVKPAEPAPYDHGGAGERPEAARFRFIGNHPALDFANTVDWTTRGLESERLGSYDDLVRWGLAAGVIVLPEAATLDARSRKQPRLANESLKRAKELRRDVHDAMAAIARRRPPRPDGLRVFNQALRSALAGLSIAWEEGLPAWRRDEPRDLDLVTHHVAWQAAQLMTSQDAARVGVCANPDCGWLFLDTTKNRSRRWCGMPECGGRAKARRYYLRKRNADARRTEHA